MSWVEIVSLPRGGNGALLSAVTMSVSAGAGKMARRISISLRPSALQGVSWLRAGAKTRLLLGEGEHAGLLRVQGGGDRPAVKTAASEVLMISSPELLGRFPALPAGAIERTPCTARVLADAIEIELPAWARRPRAGVFADGRAAIGVPSKPIPLEPGAVIGGKR